MEENDHDLIESPNNRAGGDALGSIYDLSEMCMQTPAWQPGTDVGPHDDYVADLRALERLYAREISSLAANDGESESVDVFAEVFGQWDIEQNNPQTRQQGQNNEVDPNNVYNNTYSDGIGSTRFHPLRKCIWVEQTHKEALVQWELYMRVVPQLILRLKPKPKPPKPGASPKKASVRMLAPMIFNVFHIQATHEATAMLQPIIEHIREKHKTHVTIEWLATRMGSPNGQTANFTNRSDSAFAMNHANHVTHTNWLSGIDGLNTITEANMRYWINQARLTMKTVDFVTGSSNNESDAAKSCILGLMMLRMGGSMLILLPSVSYTETLAAISIVGPYFQQMEIIHPFADDVIYLHCAWRTNTKVTVKVTDNLYKFCNRASPRAAHGLVRPQSLLYPANLARIRQAICAIYTWRVVFYRSRFMGHVCEDRSDQWIRENGWPATANTLGTT
jgi:hypothetical protein